jgi:hypothetical protein
MATNAFPARRDLRRFARRRANQFDFAQASFGCDGPESWILPAPKS